MVQESPRESPSGGVLTALLCGLTEYSVDNLRHQFSNCFHRLRWVTEHALYPSITVQLLPGGGQTEKAQLLPGGGQTEASCIKMLEGEAEEANIEGEISKLPLYFTRSWMSNASVMLENGWRGSVYQAFSNGMKKYLARCVLNASPGVGQFEALSRVEEMIRSSPPRSEGVEGLQVMDVAVSKREAWQRAVELLETIFLSQRVEMR